MADAFDFAKTVHAIQGHENVYGLVTFWRNNQLVPITTHLRSCQRENHIHYFFLAPESYQGSNPVPDIRQCHALSLFAFVLATVCVCV